MAANRFTAGDGIQIEGLDQLRRSLRGAPPELRRLLGRAMKTAASVYSEDAKRSVSSAPGPGPKRSSTKRLIGASGTQKGAAVKFRSTNRGSAIAAVLGANVHPVFGRRRLQSTFRRPVWPYPHLGSGWKPEDLYGVGPVFRLVPEKVFDELTAAYVEAVDGWLRKA